MYIYIESVAVRLYCHVYSSREQVKQPPSGTDIFTKLKVQNEKIQQAKMGKKSSKTKQVGWRDLRRDSGELRKSGLCFKADRQKAGPQAEGLKAGLMQSWRPRDQRPGRSGG